MRPSMSWLVVALALFSGNLLVQASPLLPSMPVAMVVGAAGAMVCIGLRWIQPVRPRWIAAAAGLAMLGYAAAAMAGIRAMSARLPVALEGRDFLVEGRVASLPVRNHDSVGFVFEIERNLDANPFRGRVRVAWFGPAGTTGLLALAALATAEASAGAGQSRWSGCRTHGGGARHRCRRLRA